MIVDADAHVVETEHTWDFLDQSEKKFRPQLFSSTDNPNMQYWFVEGKSIGFRPPTLTEPDRRPQHGRDRVELALRAWERGRPASWPLFIFLHIS